MNQPKPPQRPSTPKPDNRLTPTPEEFTAWCEHPTTRWVAAAWSEAAKAQERAWNGLLTAPGDGDMTLARVELSTRADAYRAFIEAGHANYLDLNTPKP